MHSSCIERASDLHKQLPVCKYFRFSPTLNVHAFINMCSMCLMCLSVLVILVNTTTLSGQSSMVCVSEECWWVGVYTACVIWQFVTILHFNPVTHWQFMYGRLQHSGQRQFFWGEWIHYLRLELFIFFAFQYVVTCLSNTSTWNGQFCYYPGCRGFSGRYVRPYMHL